MKRLSISLVFLFVSGWMILFFSFKPTLLTDIGFSHAIYDEHQHLLRLTLSRDEKFRLYTPLSEIPPQLIETTLLQEDRYFYQHYGINPFAMWKAGWQTYFIHSRRMGASTITMQVARMRFRINSKTVTGKILQIIRSIQLEMHYSKNQILEAYFNLAPYGNNVEGVGAASLIYFGKPIQHIALSEALMLSVIPQNPNQRTPAQKKIKTIRDKLFARWLIAHPEDNNKKSIINLPLATQNSHTLPFIAPHFVNTILNSLSPTEKSVATTLDVNLQTILERVTHQYLARKNNLGVYNTAVLLVDTRDMAVKAMIGSADFFNTSIAGQINGTEIKRSPGSTLKPFIYGLALDQGLIHPATILKDVPHSFGNYNPENFDYDFIGPVKARDALTLSRNIPAIFLASQLTHPNLYELLEQANVSHLKSESYYGLALALGGAELNMQELTCLYAMLVNDGIWHSLRFRQDVKLDSGKRLLSPEASFLVLNMLKNTARPDASPTLNIPIAWKTGTSSRYRDAWTIGTFGPYVLAVWVGNFNNKSNKAFVGKNIAAPLFFELIDAIDHERGPLPILQKHPETMNLIQTEVCKASGMLPTRYCRDTELTWFIPGKSPIKTDTIYREIPIDKKTGLRTCQFNQNTEFKIYEFWSSDLLKIFKQAGISRRTPPPFDPKCTPSETIGLIPQITSPQTQLNYIFRANASQKLQIPFTAIADADVTTLYWFINETYLGTSPRDQTYFWHAKPGKFTVRVVDDHGRSDAREVVIQVES